MNLLFFMFYIKQKPDKSDACAHFLSGLSHFCNYFFFLNQLS